MWRRRSGHVMPAAWPADGALTWDSFKYAMVSVLYTSEISS